MTRVRYWAMMFATAACGAFIAIERFAFGPAAAVWIAFGVAIVATVASVRAFLFALARENHAFSGLGALAALVAAWTIIATRVLNTSAALWVAFAAGIVLLLVALRALALHETTVERVVHALAPAPDQSALEGPAPGAAMTPRSAISHRRAPVRISAAMRSWMYWLAHTALALAGGLVVLMTFALTAAGHRHASARWLAFAIAIAALCISLGAMLERVLPERNGPAGEHPRRGRLAAIALSGASAAVAIALIVTMIVLSGDSARWVAFALGCGFAGISLLALAVHELTSERVRHELEIAQPTPGARARATPPPATA